MCIDANNMKIKISTLLDHINNKTSNIHMYSMTIFEIPQNNIKKLSNIFIMILANSTFMQYNIDSSSSFN